MGRRNDEEAKSTLAQVAEGKIGCMNGVSSVPSSSQSAHWRAGLLGLSYKYLLSKFTLCSLITPDLERGRKSDAWVCPPPPLLDMSFTAQEQVPSGAHQPELPDHQGSLYPGPSQTILSFRWCILQQGSSCLAPHWIWPEKCLLFTKQTLYIPKSYSDKLSVSCANENKLDGSLGCFFSNLAMCNWTVTFHVNTPHFLLSKPK